MKRARSERMFWKFLVKDIHQSYHVVGFCVGILMGTVLGLVWRVNYFSSSVWILLVLLLLLIAYVKPKATFVILALIAGMVLAFFRISADLYGENYIKQFVGKDVVVTGVVRGDPNTDERGVKVKLDDLRLGEEAKLAEGNIYITLKGDVEVKRADILAVEGKLSDGFGTYAGYMYRPKIKSIRRAEPGDLILNVRNWFADRIKRLISETEASLGLSYLLGMKTGLSEEFADNLRTVGLTHIVVASGAHLSILVEVARKIFGRLSRFAGLLFSVLFVVFFMSMVGWTPSIMRAGVMAILSLITWYVGRKIVAWRLILLVMAFTLMLEPSFVMNLGWLLSFASFAGIMILGPKMSKFFFGEREPGFVASTVMTTIAATLMTLPITLYYFGTVSLISVIANLLILPTLPIAMGLTFLTGVVAGVPLIGTVVAWCATKMLDFHIAVVEFFGAEREFLVEIEPYQWWVFLFYGVIIIGLLVGLIRQKMIKLRGDRI